jgi:hypothetical protein
MRRRLCTRNLSWLRRSMLKAHSKLGKEGLLGHLVCLGQFVVAGHIEVS